MGRFDDTLENELLRVIALKLHVGDLLIHKKHFAYEIFAADHLNQESSVVLLRQVPMIFFLIKKKNVWGAGPNDAVVMRLQPLPKLIEG